MKKYLKIILIVTAIIIFPRFVLADNLLEKRDFYIDSYYDLNNREKITAVLQRITNQLYFYVDDNWWNSLDVDKRREANKAIDDLSKEFENKIHPVIAQNYGFEESPGIDNDQRITILVQPMIEGAAGYFNPSDEYPKSQVPKSNQREMIYLSTWGITAGPITKSLFAHEFTHLVTFNQKEKTFGVSEETWLNEARAEYAPTLLGYDNNYEGSNLQRRIKTFLESPGDSLTEWQGKPADYGALNLFTQYLVDHYGKQILTDSLHSDKTGISSINEALKNNGFKEDFSQIFTNWTITAFINDCALGPNYCYLNDNLKNLKVTPFIYFLPTTGESKLSVGYLAKDWAGNWQKIIGGQNSLKLEFSENSSSTFEIPYIVEDANAKLLVKFLELDNSKNGTIYLDDGKINSLTIIPSAQNKTSGFGDKDPSYQYSWSASNEKQGQASNLETIKQLQDRITYLNSIITNLQAQLAALALGNNNNSASVTCQKFENNLYYGMKNNNEVFCLQQFLKSQGVNIYPEGLTTGNFGTLTQGAVIRFQEKYNDEILAPLGLKQGTGFVGLATRNKINQMM